MKNRPQTQPQTTSNPRENPRSRRQPLTDAALRVRPSALAALLGGGFAAGTLPAGLTLIALEFDGVVEGIVIWTIATVFLALPLAATIGVVGWRAERALTGCVPPPSAFWPLAAMGISAVALWVPMCAWAPLLLLASVLRPRDADEYLPLAVVSLASWAVVAAGMGLLVAARRFAAQRDWSASAQIPYAPSKIPTTLLLAIASALIAAMPAGLWLAWLDEIWSHGSGLPGVVSWGLSGAGGAVLAAWLAGAFSIGATSINPRLGVRVRSRQLEVLGAVFAGQWSVVFLFLLSPALRNSDDLRFSVLFVSFFAVAAGTVVWSSARAVRVGLLPLGDPNGVATAQPGAGG